MAPWPRQFDKPFEASATMALDLRRLQVRRQLAPRLRRGSALQPKAGVSIGHGQVLDALILVRRTCGEPPGTDFELSIFGGVPSRR